MHKRQLAGFIIDCQAEDLDQVAQFWGQAPGQRIMPSDDEEDQNHKQWGQVQALRISREKA